MPADKDEDALRAEMLGDDTANLEDAVAAEAGEDLEPGIDPNHPILTVAEQREAITRARAKVSADDKKAALKQFEAMAVENIRGKEGMRTGDPVKDELVSISLDLAEHANAIVLNSHAYWHGQTYEVPRHIADTLREIQSRGWNHQAEIDGKGLVERMRQPRDTILSAKKGVLNAPQRAA